MVGSAARGSFFSPLQREPVPAGPMKQARMPVCGAGRIRTSGVGSTDTTVPKNRRIRPLCHALPNAQSRR